MKLIISLYFFLKGWEECAVEDCSVSTWLLCLGAFEFVFCHCFSSLLWKCFLVLLGFCILNPAQVSTKVSRYRWYHVIVFFPLTPEMAFSPFMTVQ